MMLGTKSKAHKVCLLFSHYSGKQKIAWHMGKLCGILNSLAAMSARMNINEFCHFCNKPPIFTKCNFHYISNYVLCLIAFWGGDGSDGYYVLNIFGTKQLCIARAKFPSSLTLMSCHSCHQYEKTKKKTLGQTCL